MSETSAPTRPVAILFTGFEPSGDDHASAVIAELRSRYSPDTLQMFAWGGPKMEAAGAQIVQRTGQSAVMGVPGLGKILEHIRIHRAVAKWLRHYGSSASNVDLRLHIPVDSPAANFPLCKLSKSRGLKVTHLVAPQVWAWASWRIHKLKRRTNLVLCLLPFEEEWFMSRGVAAKFVGHPLFDDELDLEAMDARVTKHAAQVLAALPASVQPGPKLALMPGSRPAEMVRCFPMLLDAFVRVKKDFPGALGLVAATNQDAGKRLKELAAAHGGWPAGLGMVVGDADAAIRWCDYAMVVSGTVTLQIARQFKPMVAVYNPGWLMYQFIARWLISTDLFTLPNLIAGRRVIPELIPHFGDGEALAVEIIKLVRRSGYAHEQQENLREVCKRFAGKRAAVASADQIEKMLGLAPRTVERPLHQQLI